MHINKSKLSFLKRIIRHRLTRQQRKCPYCGELSDLELIGRKKLLLDVIRCSNCLLIFRYPMDTASDNQAYYQDEYQSGVTTLLPDDEAIKNMKESGFDGALDLTPKIEVLKSLKPEGKALDLGCSWGYGVYQLGKSGYQAVGFEVSMPRAAYGRAKLDVEIIDNMQKLNELPDKTFDVVFTNHVLEHLPNLSESLNLINRILKDDGISYNILPNFTGKAAREGAFWSWIGEAHPIGPTVDFFKRNLQAHGFNRVVCGSGPFTPQLKELVQSGDWERMGTDGSELLVLAWKS